MNKRVIAFLCALALLVGLLPAGAATVASAETNTQRYQVGYAIKDINPWVNNLSAATKVFVDPAEATQKELYTDLFQLTGNNNDTERTLAGLFDDNGDGVFYSDEEYAGGDGLFTTATSVTYNNETVIFITIDMIQAYDNVTTDIRNAIVAKLGNVISADHIMVSASHTHSGPKLQALRPGDNVSEADKTDANRYYEHVIDQIADAAGEAYDDRAAATMSKGTVNATDATAQIKNEFNNNAGYNDGKGYHMNAVRHYEVTLEGYNSSYEKIEKKYLVGSTDQLDRTDLLDDFDINIKSYGFSKKYSPVEESDNDMHVLLFQFDDPTENAPVVFVNWRAHTTMNSSVNKELLSSDYVNGLRTTLNNVKSDTAPNGYRAAFFQGAAGNIVTAAKEEVWNTENSEFAEYKDWLNEVSTGDNKTFIYGRMLAEIAQYCIEGSQNMQECTAGAIRTHQMTWRGEKRPENNIMLAALDEIESKDEDSIDYPYVYTDPNTKETYIVNSSLHKSAIKNRSTATTAYDKLELNAILLGNQVAFVTAPNELVDKYYNYSVVDGETISVNHNSWKNLIDNDTYGTPFVLGYSNGRREYIGNWLDYTANSSIYYDITGKAKNGGEFFTPGTYESFTSRLAQGQGEVLIKKFGTMLNLLQDSPRVAKCEACGETVEWTPVTSGFVHSNTSEKVHYYLAEDIVDTGKDGQWEIGDGTNQQTTCIDLMGHDKTSEFRNFRVKKNSILNLMDSVGGGKVQGTTYDEHVYGGNIYVEKEGEFNLYGGILSFNKVEKTAYEGVGRGGVIYVDGTMNMYGGTVEGADLVMSKSTTVTSNNGCGGAIYVNYSSYLNVCGGTITSGTVPDGGYGPCVFIHGSTAYVTLGGNAKVDNIYFYNNAGKNLTLSGAYTGTANLTFYQINSSTTINDGADIGECEDNASLSGANITCTNTNASVYIEGTNLKLPCPTKGATLIGSNGEVPYDTFAKAVENYSSGHIKLMEDVSVANINRDMTIDLNGHNMSKVEVNDGCTLYGMDSQTDDYVIEGSKDNYSGFGKIGEKTGDGTVAAVQVDDLYAEDGYMMVNDDVNKNISFHRVKLQVRAMTLRSIVDKKPQPSIYYNSYFKGDQMVAQNVDSFGVALSVYEMPNDTNIDTTCKCSKFTTFNSGENGNPDSSTGTLLRGIMKQDNTSLINSRNANMEIYGRAYVKLNDGRYLFGEGVSRTLKEQVEMVDDSWDKLTKVQKTSAMEMHDTYNSVMDKWDIPNITAQSREKDDGVLRVLMIGHSLGNDAMWMQPEVFTNEASDTNVVLGFLYYSGCKLHEHVKFAKESTPVYAYAEFDSRNDTYWQVANTDGTMRAVKYGETLNGEDPKYGISQTSLFAIQRQDWDVVVTQGYPWEAAKVQSTSYDPDLLGNLRYLKQFVLHNDINKETTPEFGWNMVWTFTTDDELKRDSDMDILNDNFANLEEYYDRTAQIVQDELMPEMMFDYVFPSSTAYINALSGYKDHDEMYRDCLHASDFGRAMIAYLWYCKLTDTDIEECKFNPINYQYRKDITAYENLENMVLTAEEKQTIIEVVGNALANPYVITPKVS